MIFIDSIRESLNSRAKCGNTQLIAIDGRAGSGKTTLASELGLAFRVDRSVSILHMDEIYAGWNDALGPTLTRTLEDLLISLSAGLTHEMPIYDWGRGDFLTSRTMVPGDLLILEGVGSGQRKVREFGSTTIWLDIDADIGLARVLERDGRNIQLQMQKWQMDENAHFSRDKTRESSDFILSTQEQDSAPDPKK